MTAITTAPAYAATTKPYTTPGQYTFTVPSGVPEIKVVLTGAGGGGDTSNSTAPGAPAFGGGGGGGGATSTCTLPVRPGDTLTITVGTGGAGGTGGVGGRDSRDGGNSTISYPNAGGASAEGGHRARPHDAYSEGGAGGYAQTWCAGIDPSLHFGQKGANGNPTGTREGGIPGMPGSGVHSACPLGTGVGGYGGNGPERKPGLPGQSGCVILTY
ncbi:glycine-rich domain-containing protein [Nonomuraea sp. NPDC005983]|uniref:glycine-rich domain-containing protein n=1 Tax=Nonomuraea sp. NPDC005983 TaxID=3155595 RepID=UPI0033BF92DE